MRRAILAQPGEIRRVAPLLRRDFTRLGLERPARIVAGGCGDSFFASQVAAGFFPPGGTSYLAATAFEIGHYLRLGRADLCILLSISGGTRRTVEAATTARQAGARTLAVTCQTDSPLARACDAVLVLPFTPLERRTPHTLDYTMTVLALAVIAESLTGQELAWIKGLAAAMKRAIDGANERAGAISDAT